MLLWSISHGNKLAKLDSSQNKLTRCLEGVLLLAGGRTAIICFI